MNALPHSVVPVYGQIPSFLVDACTSLEEHLHTEGLFRKSGSVIRLKALKSKLDHGENCLSSAPPCDVAGLLKQFFRELPEPILPANLHEALFKAQQLGLEEKNNATLLISCLMPDHTIEIMRYFFNFLRNVSLRSSENKMDSSNLAVIFAPNLLQTSEVHEKMSAHTEKKLRVQAAVVQTLIDYASDIGHIPVFILEKIPTMLGIDGICATPSVETFEESEHETPGDCKRKRRQSVGDFVSGALNKFKSNRTPSITPQHETVAQQSVTPVILTPNTKRKLPIDSSHGVSSKKRKSIKHNFNLDLLPSNLFSSSSTPISVHFDTSSEGSSRSSISPLVISGSRLLGADVPRRSKRIANKKICRVESGKAGCFSPKINRKEKVRRSLRLKFSLGRSNKEVNECSSVNRRENIGRRLANQQSLKNRIESVKTGLLFSPDIDERLTKKGSKKISKSEENLLTPKRQNPTSNQMSWAGTSNSQFQEAVANEVSPTLIERNLEVEHSSLEPGIIDEKLPVNSYELTPSDVHSKHSNSVIRNSSGDGNSLTTETLVKIQKAFSESGSSFHLLLNPKQSPVTNVGEEKLSEASTIEYSPEKNLFEIHDLTVIESNEHLNSKDESSFSGRPLSVHETQKLVEEATIKCHSVGMKIEARKSIHSNIPNDCFSEHEFSSGENIKQSPEDRLNTELREDEDVIGENLLSCITSKEDEDTTNTPSSEQMICTITDFSQSRPVRNRKQSLVAINDKTIPESLHMAEHGRVSDHIQWFNKLSLNEPNRTKVKSPLKFQRTPVRQSVRRINSLLEYNRQPVRRKLSTQSDATSPLVKAVSCESALYTCMEGTSKNSVLCSKSVLKQKSTCEQSNDAISKSHMEFTSKSFSKIKGHPDFLTASLGSSRVCKPEVITDNQIKVPLDDLTNQNILKSVVNNNRGFSPGINNQVLRKPSERERIWYKGSPKNPIGKTQLLPTSKPVDL